MNTDVPHLSLNGYLVNLILVGLVAVGGALFVAQLFVSGNYPLGIIFSTVIVFLCMIYARRRLTPYRWLGLAIALLLLYTIYPIIYTIYLALTMFGFEEILSSDAFRSSLGRLFFWNVAFAFFSVFFSFVLGLITALLFTKVAGKRVIRGVLIIPYLVPIVISVLMWRMVLTPDSGLLNNLLEGAFGLSYNWFSDRFWAKVSLILINVWLLYPYFFIMIEAGLKSIPKELDQAALIDGASSWELLRYIKLPLLLRMSAPLLIASFIFNFNQFNLIYLFNGGGLVSGHPDMGIGDNDILISLVYKVVFAASETADYGVGAAISTILFLFISLIGVIQFRLTDSVKEA